MAKGYTGLEGPTNPVLPKGGSAVMAKKKKQEDKDALQRDVTPLDICRYDYRKHIFKGFFDTINDSVEFTPSGWGTGETTDLTKTEFKHFAQMVQRMYQDILALEDKYGDSDD